MQTDLKNMKFKKKEFRGFNVLVIGDSCEDIFQYGNINRLCPEAPVPVFNPTTKRVNPGMASNVLDNLKALGLNAFIITNKEQIKKTRIIDERTNQMIVRLDDKDFTSRISSFIIESIKNNTYDNIKYDAIIISDYDKGFLEEDDIDKISKFNTNVFIDTKKVLGDWCLGSSYIKVNNIEFERTEYTIKNLNIEDKLIVTYREKGARYLNQWFPVEKVEIKDVSGAGDTFLSGLVAEYLLTNDIRKSIVFAQQCATVVVQKPGVCTI
jgi:D-beta-D-heptose 7-phosphate kinase/D-beta-D-heptose 1-phosphate adenosyltransferase